MQRQAEERQIENEERRDPEERLAEPGSGLLRPADGPEGESSTASQAEKAADLEEASFTSSSGQDEKAKGATTGHERAHDLSGNSTTSSFASVGLLARRISNITSRQVEDRLSCIMKPQFLLPSLACHHAKQGKRRQSLSGHSIAFLTGTARKGCSTCAG